MVPIALKMAVSKGVLKLKCEGTPRQVCSEISSISPVNIKAIVPLSQSDKRLRFGKKLKIQLVEIRVTPPDKPKVIGFRNDTGPDNEPPVANSGIICSSPKTIMPKPSQ
jgi:hypothetical protein